MDNLKRPADTQPMTTLYDGNVITSWQHHEDFAGFTKLELASLMIAQGYVANGGFAIIDRAIAEYCVQTAKAVLEEANK
jgi:hypothetical protein